MDLSNYSDEELLSMLKQLDAKDKNKDDGSIIDPLLQGATLGFADELGGFGSQIGKFLATGKWDSSQYERGRDKERSDYEAFSERNPKTALAAEVLGGLATGGASGGLSKAAGMKMLPLMGERVAQLASTSPKLARALSAAGVAGIEGGAAGFGGSKENTMSGILEDTAKGVALGGALGGTFDALGQGFSNFSGRAISPEEKAFQMVDDITGGIQGATNRPRTESFADMAMGVKPSAMLADTSPEAARGLRGIRTHNPAAQEIIDKRLNDRYIPDMMSNEGGQYERIRASVDQVGGDTSRSLEDIARQRAEDAKVNYRAANESTPTVPSEFVADFLGNKQFKNAYEQAKTINENAITLGETNYRLPDIDELIDPDTGDILIDSLPLESVDFIKRGIDSYLGSNAEGLTKVVRSQVRAMKNKMLANVDALSDEYKKARESFADTSSLISAGEEGQNFLKLGTNELKETLHGMTPAEVDVFRSQALDVVSQALGKPSDNADLVKRLAGSPQARSNLKLLLGDERYNQLATNLIREAKQVDTRQLIMGGSNTADKLADAKNAEDQLTAALDILLQGEIVKPAIRTAAAFFSKPRLAKTKEAQRIAADVMTETSPYKMMKNVNTASMLKKARQARADQAAKYAQYLPLARRAIVTPTMIEEE